ncbi:hypothetical protein A3Q56_01166 [Intoshia linei]|uniref:Uncharacterized protein n=1 Tax=Intoshia linei TaxID=1819745 RepID=A0A177B9T7_9BILA|nr:hypothetical protein A3Q56_01166 [Intoshia linei]
MDIIDPNYALIDDKYTNQKKGILIRLTSFMDTFHINVSNQNRIPFFIKALFVEFFMILALAGYKITGSFFIIKCIIDSTMNETVGNILEIILNIVENMLGFQLLTFSMNSLYEKYKNNKNSNKIKL